jgi:hypothetical protein
LLEFARMQHRWIARLCLLIALSGGACAHAAEATPLVPFQAEYQVSRNGKELGHATLTLRQSDRDTWEFTNETRGTNGMASMLGLDIVERSAFRWRDGLPEGLQYRYEQRSAVKSRRRSVEFDWDAREARNSDGKRDWVAPLDRSAMDRNLVTLAIMTRLKAGSRDLVFPVVDKDRVAEQRYVPGARESLSLPAGTIEAVRVDRRREDSSRTTTLWLAPRRGWLPVQIEQVEKNGETITMRLAASR